MGVAHRRLTPDFNFICSDGGMNGIRCDIYVYHLGLCMFFPGVFLSSKMTEPVTTDLIMRVRVRSTTTTTNILDGNSREETTDRGESWPSGGEFGRLTLTVKTTAKCRFE